LKSGGLTPNVHPIIQLAAIAVDERLDVLEAFEAKIRFNPKCANAYSPPEKLVSSGRLGFKWPANRRRSRKTSRSSLRRHASVSTLSAKGERYEVAQLVAHNAPFDGPFLSEWYERLRTYLPARRQLLCTLQLALWHFAMTERAAARQLPARDCVRSPRRAVPRREGS
jgi:hypothetical protein